MDIAEFLERIGDTKLPEWQKEHIKMLYEVSKDKLIYISMNSHLGRNEFYTYLKPSILRELTQHGTTPNSY